MPVSSKSKEATDDHPQNLQPEHRLLVKKLKDYIRTEYERVQKEATDNA